MEAPIGHDCTTGVKNRHTSWRWRVPGAACHRQHGFDEIRLGVGVSVPVRAKTGGEALLQGAIDIAYVGMGGEIVAKGDLALQFPDASDSDVKMVSRFAGGPVKGFAAFYALVALVDIAHLTEAGNRLFEAGARVELDNEVDDGLGGEPGTEVLPTWWMCRARGPSVFAALSLSWAKTVGHAGS